MAWFGFWVSMAALLLFGGWRKIECYDTWSPDECLYFIEQIDLRAEKKK